MRLIFFCVAVFIMFGWLSSGIVKTGQAGHLVGADPSLQIAAFGRIMDSMFDVIIQLGNHLARLGQALAFAGLIFWHLISALLVASAPPGIIILGVLLL